MGKYCIENFHCSRNRELTAETVVGEAMTLIFAFFHNFVASHSTGNLLAIRLVREHYPKSILYVDSHDFIALHGACCVLNLPVIKYFINWHLNENPNGRG